MGSLSLDATWSLRFIRFITITSRSLDGASRIGISDDVDAAAAAVWRVSLSPNFNFTLTAWRLLSGLVLILILAVADWVLYVSLSSRSNQSLEPVSRSALLN
eukprot:scaffold102425_cov44-Attheya_sp.AAC.1